MRWIWIALMMGCTSNKIVRVENQLLSREVTELRDQLTACSAQTHSADYLQQVDMVGVVKFLAAAGHKIRAMRKTLQVVSSHLPCGFALAGFANRGRFYPRGCGLCRTVWATYNDGITRQFPSPTITLGRAGGGRRRTPPLTRFDRGLGVADPATSAPSRP